MNNGTPGEKITRLDERSKDHERRIGDVESKTGTLFAKLNRIEAELAKLVEIVGDGKKILFMILAPVLGAVGLSVLAIVYAFTQRPSGP